MVMVTAKLSKQKLLLIAALLVAVVVVLCLCLHGSGNSSETPDTAQEPVAVDVKTNEGRLPRELWLGGRGGAGADAGSPRPDRAERGLPAV